METPSQGKPTPPCTKTKITTAPRRRSDWPKTIQPRGAEALRSIVADDVFDLDIRSEAAARLAEVGG